MDKHQKEDLIAISILAGGVSLAASIAIIPEYRRYRKLKKRELTFLRCSNQARLKYEEVILAPGSTLHDALNEVNAQRVFLWHVLDASE